MCLADITDTATYARVAQLVEHDLAKVGAAGSSPVSRLSEKWIIRQDGSFFYVQSDRNTPNLYYYAGRDIFIAQKTGILCNKNAVLRSEGDNVNLS